MRTYPVTNFIFATPARCGWIIAALILFGAVIERVSV